MKNNQTSDDVKYHRIAKDRVGEALSRVAYKLIETPEDRDEIYRLRYRAYLQEGAIDPNESGIVTDEFDDVPNSWIFGVFYDGVLSSSLRISISFPSHPETPSTHVFPDLLGEHVRAGRIMIDPTRFVADPNDARKIMMLPYLTMRLAYMAADHFKADYGISSVRTEHLSFYKRTFKQKQLSDARDYPGLKKPICLLLCDYKADTDLVTSRYPIFVSSEEERARLFARSERFMSPRNENQRTEALHRPASAATTNEFRTSVA